jgi:di/tricarboxylate transporter
MAEIWIVFAIIAAVIGLFVWDRLPVIAVCVGCSMALWATGVLSLNQALAGFGDPATVFVTSLFVVSGALEKTGLTAWTGQMLARGAGASRFRLIVLMMLSCGVLSALISVNGAVAALLPVVVVLAVRLKRPPSQLLMPLVFGAHAGSMLALTGTPVNVLVSDAAVDVGLPPFRYFEFAKIGIPLLLGSMAIILLLGHRVLPNRKSRYLPRDLSTHARTLVEQYRLHDGLFRLQVGAGSPFVGAPRGVVDLREYPGLTLVGIEGGGRDGPVGQPTIAEGDVLVVRGDARTVARLHGDKALAFRGEVAAGDVAAALLNRASGLAEVVIPPRSGLVGQAVFPGMITESGDLIVLAVQRNGEDQGPKETALAAGDTLLLQGTWKALDEHLDDPNVLVVDSPDLVRRQAVPMGAGSKQAIAVLLGMVVLLATGAVPAVVAGLLAASAMVLLKVLTVEQAYHAVNWTTVILVGAMMPLSTAMQQSGAAAMLAEALVGTVGDAGPYALLAGLFVLTAVLGQLISNTATALIIIPIAVAAAAGMGISPVPVLMSVNVAAAAAFLTPVATPVNLMVMGPGGYRFDDYWKLGGLMLLWFFVAATFLVPVFWPF